MRREMTIALCLASLSGMVAAVGAYDWISSMADNANRRPQIAAAPAMDLTKVVVAKEGLTFGSVLTAEKLRVAEWPTNSVPAGSFQSIEDMFAEEKTRTVLEAMREKEAVLKGKITGPGQRASLSTMLREGMKAVSVRVDDVVGVAGFVLPGDYVDVLITFGKPTEDQSQDRTKKKAFRPYTEMLLQKLRVLAIDQTADPRQDAAKLARTVTLEATQVDAQKITLAGNIATLSLILREQAALVAQVDQRRVTADDLSEDSGDKGEVAVFEPTIAVAPTPPPAPTEPVDTTPRAKVNIWRGVAAAVEHKEHIVDRVRVGE